MPQYQTTIQKPSAIRFGSAKIEWKGPDATEWIDLGALKTVAMTTNTDGEQKFEPDNAPPIIRDPQVNTWQISADVLECFNITALKEMFGDIHTYTAIAESTTIGVYAGTGKRPYGSLRITNTTPDEMAVILTLTKVKLTSELDFTFPTDKDGTTSIALPATWVAELDGDQGFGTLVVPNLS